jgi:DNA-binding NtrC family response regulator
MSQRKILIVDDEAAIRSLLRLALEGPSLVVFDADCGDKALSLAAQQGSFDLVVTDVVMPGMDGLELAMKLSAAGLASNFLFISGFCDMETASRQLDGISESAFLAKPFSIPDLLSAVRRLLSAPPVKARSASVRQRGSHSALRRPATPLDGIRALRRKADRLRANRLWLLQTTRACIRLNSILMQRSAAQLEAIRGLQGQTAGRRAILERCSARPLSSSSC